VNYKVSIIIPYYRKKLFILDALKSALNQTYKNFEIIIIYDDPSRTDLEYVKRIVKFNKKITLLINKRNLGAGSSRNKGIKYSKGDYIAFLDADDFWDRKKLALQINFMKRNKISFSHTSYRILNLNSIVVGRQIAANNISYSDLLNSCDICLSTVVAEKKILKEFPFKKLKTKEDYSVWLRIIKKYEIIGFRKVLASWRKTNLSLSSSLTQKLKDAFYIYFYQEKFSFFTSILKTYVLCLFFIKKKIEQKKNLIFYK